MTESSPEIPVRSLYFEKPGVVSIREYSVRGPKRGEVVVKTLFSAISAGTESLIYKGQWPQTLAVDETIPTLAGRFSYPLKYGYSAVGRIIDVGKNVSPEWIGRLAFAFNPHETHFVTSPDKLILIPEGITPKGACFLPNMETALNLVMDGNPIFGETVAIFGQGVVGLLTTALLSRMSLEKIVTFDKYLMRRQASALMGADLCVDPGAGFGMDQFEEFFANSLTDDGRADLTYELSGLPQVLNQAISITGYGGRIVVGSFYGSKNASIEFGGWFHRSRIKLISSQVSSIAPELTGRWSKTRRLGFAIKMVSQIEPERLVTHEINFSNAGKAYELLIDKPQETIQVILSYEEGK
ncbi:MAG: zinc-dependent alcohol dehydrogenase [Desulfomonilaceae bacterium]